MYLVPRRVRVIAESQDKPQDQPTLSLEDYREASAWVLLGEPGSGKSKAFEAEAKTSNGICISIAEFLIDTPDTDWQGKTLFLDGLDETRAGAGDNNTLLKLRAKLKALGKPRFRIACRAADWFGATDRESIRKVSPDEQWVSLLLEPLNQAEISDILRLNHQVPDPEAFIQKAGDLKLDGLLDNPQTLELLAKSIRNGQWPATRLQTFELACATLADEESKPHRQKLTASPVTIESLLTAAGQLCSVLLLADKTGLALDKEQANERFPDLAEFSPPDLPTARLSVRRKLFRPASSEERFQPCHRSIAEFLAARWLGRQIDQHGLPLGRLLNLMLSRDGRTIAGLRGLYGWLALHCQAARQHLIKADPLTVIAYGDVKPMAVNDKQQLLASLAQETEQNPAFRWSLRSRSVFGALADPALAVDFLKLLKSPDRDDVSQAFLATILDILSEGEPLPALAETLKSVAIDGSRWGQIRENALLAWVNGAPPAIEAMALLDAINDGQITDPDDELAGQLLPYLYPKHIAPEHLFSYLHPRKSENLTGTYAWFWSYSLIKTVPTSHLPTLLDKLAVHSDLPASIIQDYHLQRMTSALLSKGIEQHGDAIDDQRLFVWLGIGADEYGDIHRENADQERISKWLEKHPERYKSLLAFALNQCRGHKDSYACISDNLQRLDVVVAPPDIGQWYLEQASQEMDDALAQYHLNNAFNALMHQRGNLGLKLEMFEAWAEKYPERKHWLDPLLSWEIDERRRNNANRGKLRKQQYEENRRTRTINLSTHIDAICAGRASPGLMHQLAGVWLNRYSDTQGDTPLARFKSYCENAEEILAAAESGFTHSPRRDDLPQVAEIIEFRTRQHEHFVRAPCLIGMDLRWRENPTLLLTLSDEQLKKMAAFWLTYDIGDTPDWYRFLVRERPALLADLFIDYVSAMLKAKQEGIAGIGALAKETDFRNLAALTVPRLLEVFPIRAQSRQLSLLESLLKTSLNNAMALPELIERKVALKSMDSTQKVYWLATAMLLDARQYEQRLWDYIGKSWVRANSLAWFISDRFSELSGEYPLSPRSIGKLIELLTPHAELGRLSGIVTPAAHLGDQVRSLITRLSMQANDEAAAEIERLRLLPAVKKLKLSLDSALHELRLKQRENSFAFPPLSSVVQVIANREPANAGDLVALTLDHLDDFARQVRSDNADLFRQFWTEAKENSPKPENSCRDALLTELRTRLKQFGIDCQPEADQFNDKRADIRLSFRNEFELPIEIKREDNRSLWTNLRTQLIDQYSKLEGYGIYLVFWFGGTAIPKANDGGRKPTSPEELRTRLENQLSPEEQKRIHVRVLDVSWPNAARKKTHHFDVKIPEGENKTPG